MGSMRLVPGKGREGKKKKSLISIDRGALSGLKTSSKLSEINLECWIGTGSKENVGLQRSTASRMRFRGECREHTFSQQGPTSASALKSESARVYCVVGGWERDKGKAVEEKETGT